MIKRVPRLVSWAVLAVSLGAIVHVLWNNHEAFALLGAITPAAVVAIMALTCVYFLVHGYRYQVVLEKCSRRRITFVSWFRIYILGHFLNVLVPQLGNLYRGHQLKLLFGVAYTQFVSTLLSVAWIGNLFNLAAVVAILSALEPGLMLGPVAAWLAVLFLVLCLALVPFLAERTLRPGVADRGILTWAQNHLAEVLRVSAGLVRDRAFMARQLVLAAVLFSIVFGLFFFCFQALGVRIGFVELSLFFALLQLATYVQITPGNIGIMELAYGLLSDQLGFGMAEGILVGTLLRAAAYTVVVALAVPMGGFSLLRSRGVVPETAPSTPEPRPAVVDDPA